MTREEAIKQIRLVLENLKANLEKDTREAFETIIPEIKESEYERIRKKILDIVRTAPFDEEKDILEDWLEKQKEQKRWSEEDERKIGRLRSIVNECASRNYALDVNGDYCEGDYAELDEWLKSLRPSWKPSEEQMTALDEYIYAKYPDTEKYSKAILSLKEELKKLM